MILRIEGLREGIYLRGQYKTDALNGGDFKLIAWNCLDKITSPNLEIYHGQKLHIPIPTQLPMKPLRSM